MSSARLSHYPTVHNVAEKLPLVQTRLEEIGLPSLSLTGVVAVYLHAFSGHDLPPEAQDVYDILSEVEFTRRFFPIRYSYDRGISNRQSTDIKKLEKHLLEKYNAVLHVARDLTPLKTYTLYRDSKQYQVDEGIHLLVDFIQVFHRSLNGWNNRTATTVPTTVRRNTTIVFILMLHCIHKLILIGRLSVQYGFRSSDFFNEPRHVSLDHRLRVEVSSHPRIQAAQEALHWFASFEEIENLFVEGLTCSIQDVVNSVCRPTYNNPGDETSHPEAGNFRTRLIASLKDFQAVIKELVPIAHSLEHRASGQSTSSSFIPVPRHRI